MNTSYTDNNLLHAVASILKAHWLTVSPITELSHTDWKVFNEYLVSCLDHVSCLLRCTGSDRQPYDNVESLREDIRSSQILMYRTVEHALLGKAYDLFRACHDAINHHQQGYCFGLVGEMKSANDLLLRSSVMLNPTTNNNDTWFIDSLVISDVVMPNLLYAVEGDWGPYNYTKVVRWPSHYFLAVLRLTKSFESGEFAPGAHDRHRLWDFVGRYEHTVG